MLKSFETSERFGHTHWIWVATALLPLAIMGCQRQPVTSQVDRSQERVAGERQEQGTGETSRVTQEASLPTSFTFGGRVWRAHQVHWVNPNASGERNVGNTPGTTGTTGDPVNGTPGTTSTDVAPATGTPDNSATGGDNDNGMGGFVMVSAFHVSGHPIYRRSDADEAVTDNIYLRADDVRRVIPNPADVPVGSSDNGTNVSPESTPESAASTPDGSTETAFVEYDAADNLLKDVEMSRLLEVTGLPATVQHGGRTWKADEVQVYDPDVFDELKPAPQAVNGLPAFVGDKKDEMWLQADFDPSLLSTSASTTTGGTESPGPTTRNDPAAEIGTSGANPSGSSPDTAVGAKGPIFVQYEAQ